MSSDEHRTGASVAMALRRTLGRTRFAVGLVFRRRSAVGVFGLTTLAYLLVYLAAIGQLAPGLGGFDVTVVADPLATLFRPALGPLTFEPVASVGLGPVTLLVSLNTFLGVLVAGLVGLNVGVSYLAWRQPAACGVGGPASGLAASVPALLSGAACCGPVVLLALGIQVSGIVLTTVQYLLPVAVVLLVASLLLVCRQVDPAVARA
jgi:hypothetical protein